MLVAQITDLHYRVDGVRLFGVVDAHAALERAIVHLNGLPRRPDAAIVSGDLTNDGDEADYASLAGMLERLDMPVYPIPGNHDRRELMRGSLAFTGVLPESGPLCYAVEDGPLRLVGLDTLAEGEVGGRLGPDQLAWLDATLAQAPDRPTLIFMHHPPFATGIDFMDTIMLEDADLFADVVRRHSQVQAVTCGHVHRSVQTRFAGTIAMIAPGVAHQVTLDLTENAESSWIAEPPACLLHLWIPGTGLVSHVSYIGDHGPPVEFG